MRTYPSEKDIYSADNLAIMACPEKMTKHLKIYAYMG